MISLTELGVLAGTDKGTTHSYLPLYEQMFTPIRQQPITVLELSSHGFGDAAATMWLQFFPNAQLYIIDDITMSVADNRLHKALGVDVWTDVAPFVHLQYFDIIIDDASHNIKRQKALIALLWAQLKPGGYYCIEDVNDMVDAAKFVDYANYSVHQFEKQKNDILVIARKPL